MKILQELQNQFIFKCDLPNKQISISNLMLFLTLGDEFPVYSGDMSIPDVTIIHITMPQRTDIWNRALLGIDGRLDEF